MERLKNPLLETSWTEHMLITPIKPNIFPHSAMPNTRPKGADIMTKSLNVSHFASGMFRKNVNRDVPIHVLKVIYTMTCWG